MAQRTRSSMKYLSAGSNAFLLPQWISKTQIFCWKLKKWQCFWYVQYLFKCNQVLSVEDQGVGEAVRVLQLFACQVPLDRHFWMCRRRGRYYTLHSRGNCHGSDWSCHSRQNPGMRGSRLGEFSYHLCHLKRLPFLQDDTFLDESPLVKKCKHKESSIQMHARYHHRSPTLYATPIRQELFTLSSLQQSV